MFTLLSEGGAMSLIIPEVGLAIWSLIIFVILWIVLGKFAFKPITKALKEREDSITTALKSAEAAKNEMASLTAKNESLLNEAKEERNKIILEAKNAAEKVRTDIIAKAEAEASVKVQAALREIDNQKKAAIAEIRNQVGAVALDIAEKVIRKELKGNAEQQAFVNEMVKTTNLN